MQFSMKECEIYLKDAFVQFKKELYECVSLCPNSSIFDHFYLPDHWTAIRTSINGNI